MPTSDSEKRRNIFTIIIVVLGITALAWFWLTGVTRAPAIQIPLKNVPEGEAHVAPDTFTMGSPDKEVERQKWNRDERQHEVTMSHAFLMQRTEVTQRQWSEELSAILPGFTASHRFSRCGPTCPAETVSWFEAVAFANLTSKAQNDLPRCYKNPEGVDYTWDDAQANRPAHWPQGLLCAGWRLPTEAEWEFAARGRGPKRDLATYAGQPNEDTLGTIAWYVNNSEATKHGIDCSEWDWKDNSDIALCGPQPVGQKSPNDLGLYDMVGNVWEWTWDWYSPYPEAPSTDPTGPDAGKDKVLRGCSWYIHPTGCRAAERSHHAPETRNGNLGFRLVRTAQPETMRNTP